MLSDRRSDQADELRNLALTIAAIDDRISRLTDAYVDQIVDRETFLARKERLLDDRATLVSRKAYIEAGDDKIQDHAEHILELVKTLGNVANLENDDHLRGLLKNTVSNLNVSGKSVEIAWRNPFLQLSKREPVPCGGPHRIKPRTGVAHEVAKIIIEHCVPNEADRGHLAEPVWAV
jgi:hypothetical protein